MAELSPILAELERMYDTLVTAYSRHLTVEPSLKPIIALASKGKKLTQVGWYHPAVWTDTQEDMLNALAGNGEEQVRRAEIVLATELLDDPARTISELFRQIIVHHRVGNRANTEGVVGANGYYPVWWQYNAGRFDHAASINQEQPSRGWSEWVPGDSFLDIVKAELNTVPFDVARQSDIAVVRPGSRMKKWRCDCTTIRCATRVVAHCDQCGKVFEWSEKDPPPRSDYQWAGFNDVPLDSTAFIRLQKGGIT